MKTSYRWLARHLPDLPQLDQVVAGLTAMGIEVAAAEPIGAEYATVELVEAVACERHPAADHLRLVTVARGNGAKTQVVTGAANGRPGDRLWYAPPGTRMLDGRVLGTANLRGVSSPGMLLSAAELGFSVSAETAEAGLWVWSGEQALGTTLLDVLGGIDTVLDLELTPNLAAFDQSAIGLARDLAAYFRKPLPARPTPWTFGQDPWMGRVDRDATPVYTLTGIQLQRSMDTPWWMQRLLGIVGQRPISPLVDLTNFLLWDLGQPLHVFDADRVVLPIEVRKARAGERLTSLDGVERTLTEDDLVIADRTQPLAMAGVMGGLTSAVTPQTRRVLLESAHFEPRGIYRTMRRHQIESDAALHFGKGTDPWAALFAPARLVQYLGDGARVTGSRMVGGIGEPRQIPWNGERVRRLLGVGWSDEEMLGDLTALGFDRAAANITVPSYRPDIEALPDIAEEVLRVHGVDQVPTRLLSGPVVPGSRTQGASRLHGLAATWAAAGYWEIVTSPFTSAERESGWVEEATQSIEVQNPLRPEDAQLRRSLVPGLVETIAQNRARREQDLALFELAPVFCRNGSLPQQQYQLAVARTLDEPPPRWPRRPPVTIYDLKAAFEWVMRRVGAVDQYGLIPPDVLPSWAHPGRALAVVDRHHHTRRGILAEVRPSRLESIRVKRLALLVLDVGDPVAWAFKPSVAARPSRFPSSYRDLSWVLPASMRYADLVACVDRVLEPVRREIEVRTTLIDRFVGEHGVSVTLRLTFQSNTATLSEDEIGPVIDRIVSELDDEGIRLRG